MNFSVSRSRKAAAAHHHREIENANKMDQCNTTTTESATGNTKLAYFVLYAPSASILPVRDNVNVETSVPILGTQ